MIIFCSIFSVKMDSISFEDKISLNFYHKISFYEVLDQNLGGLWWSPNYLCVEIWSNLISCFQTL